MEPVVAVRDVAGAATGGPLQHSAHPQLIRERGLGERAHRRASPTGALLSCNACRLSPCTPAPLQQLTRPTPRPSSQRHAAPSSALGIRSKLFWSVQNLLMGIFCVSSALLRAQMILDLGSPEHRPLILSFSLTNRMIASLCPVRQSTLQPAWESFHRKFQSFNRKREILSLGTA